MNSSLKSKPNIQFHTRLVNKTNIAFSQSERTLLEKGLKYNLHYKDKKWINRLALEADSAISLVNPLQQNFLKHLVAKHIQKLKQKYSIQNYNKIKAKQEWKILKEIKQKITNNNLIITRADKGRTVVITEYDEYKAKILDFINDNNYTEINTDPTKSYHRTIKNTVNKCNILIPKDKKWQTNIQNPELPQIKAFIKLHKTGNPIRPIVNF
jgi:hypothetical protein